MPVLRRLPCTVVLRLSIIRGKADWDSIAQLRELIPDVPILGNGDIFSAEDAVRMVEQTGVDGVVIGRGCQGRPWLFGDLQNAFEGSSERIRPTLTEVSDMIYRHAELLVETFGDETRGLREIRKHVAWYFKGYPVGGELAREDGSGARPGDVP